MVVANLEVTGKLSKALLALAEGCKYNGSRATFSTEVHAAAKWSREAEIGATADLGTASGLAGSCTTTVRGKAAFMKVHMQQDRVRQRQPCWNRT